MYCKVWPSSTLVSLHSFWQKISSVKLIGTTIILLLLTLSTKRRCFLTVVCHFLNSYSLKLEVGVILKVKHSILSPSGKLSRSGLPLGINRFSQETVYLFIPMAFTVYKSSWVYCMQGRLIVVIIYQWLDNYNIIFCQKKPYKENRNLHKATTRSTHD